MKNIIPIMCLCLISVISCKEDYVGQFPIDNIPPQQVSNVVVENLAGKAVLTYRLPNEADLLYVKVVYQNTKGEQKEVRASVFSNSLEIPGFGRSKKTTVKLISIDRSQNESAPLLVEIEPLDSPIYDMLQNILISETWGGIKFVWTNPNKEQIGVSVLQEKAGEKQEMISYYTTELLANKSIRGLDTIPYHIAVTIRDVYGNVSDTIWTTKKPIYEIKLPAKAQFKELPLSSVFTVSPFSKGWASLWDGKINDENSVYYLALSAPQPYFTVDMGKKYIFSRMVSWQRTNYSFALHNPRFFEVWGTSDFASTQDPNNWNGWTKLASFESKKPSGNLQSVAPTAEDLAYAKAGENFDFVDMSLPVRYIRFKSVENWTKSNGLIFGEIELYGKLME